MSKYIVALIFSVLITGCTSSSSLSGRSSATPVNFSTLYLRGVFNWWEALPAYKFTPLDDSQWTVDVELIADGQPYDFRLSDENWTPSQSCGAVIKSQPVILGTQSVLTCKQSSQNLQFTPTVTGFYRFQISQPKSGEVLLTVSRIR
ncbi:hypothetical protein [Alteromonas sp. KUL49]|uniref:hypothetical protein n=1 Tax=Alteromonas sp. KUL49 TaxID=2480798 RepID=UPI00102EF751|nr:hypothetical protein [Alteromonas sp. KUL49]TAP42073.1 hypothetical protein EYS00_00130 [Alteromonas sp. KUL49]GEA09650.1 hypothetical protein KUL49_00250 [Alteromonas sp. KUL49]